MTDLEITRLCAEAMFDALEWEQRLFDYDPLHDDAQAMALFKRFPIECLKALDTEIWGARGPDEEWAESPNLNRAICECVAKMKVGEK